MNSVHSGEFLRTLAVGCNIAISNIVPAAKGFYKFSPNVEDFFLITVCAYLTYHCKNLY